MFDYSISTEIEMLPSFSICFDNLTHTRAVNTDTKPAHNHSWTNQAEGAIVGWIIVSKNHACLQLQRHKEQQQQKKQNVPELQANVATVPKFNLVDLIVCQLKENEKIISKPTCTGVSSPFETTPSCDGRWAWYRRYSKFFPGSSRRTTAYSASEFRKYRRSVLGLGPPNRISSEFVGVMYVKSGYARIAPHCNSLFGFRVSGSWTGSKKTTSKKRQCTSNAFH